MTHSLRTLFEFQATIIEMQGKIVKARADGVSEDVLAESIARVDKLIEVYSVFDSYYYRAHFMEQKVLALESKNLDLSAEVANLRKERDGLLKSIEWK